MTSDRPLSERLRTGTRTQHRAAESQQFITDLLAGALDTTAYTDLAAQHLEVYRALEDAEARVRLDRRGAGLVLRELGRVASIERDLAHLHGPTWRRRVTTLPATRDYAARVRGAGLPEYAAHAYTRYLGDLSGGQVVKRMVQRHYGIDAAGLTFYDFPAAPTVKDLRDRYRRRLDSLGLDEAETTRAVTEAQEAFRLNRALLRQLAERHRPHAPGVVA